MSSCKVSTLLFKFDGLGDVLSADELRPNQISDFATGDGVWKDTPTEVTPRGYAMPRSDFARDRHGNNWSLQIRLNYFYRGQDDSGNLVPNNLVNSHVIRLSLDKYEQRGDRMSDSATARSLDYTVCSEVKITARDSNGDVFGDGWSGTSTNRFRELRGCIDKFMMRSEVLDEANNLLTEDGSFVIGMEVKDTIVPSSINIPHIVQSKKMMKLLDSAKDSDVEFIIGSTTFPAHKLILTMHAPLLASFFEHTTSVEIKDTLPEVFRFALEYLYGFGEPDRAFLLEHNMAIIDLADRFELIELKLEAEAAMIASFTITSTDVVDQIVFADQKNCPLLKELAVRFFVKHIEEVVVSDSFTAFAKLEEPELLAELMLALRTETLPYSGNGGISKWLLGEPNQGTYEETFEVTRVVFGVVSTGATKESQRVVRVTNHPLIWGHSIGRKQLTPSHAPLDD